MTFAMKSRRLADQSPGTNVLFARCSREKACCSHIAWANTQSPRIVKPFIGCLSNDDFGR